jgi:acetyl-CoA synthetase
MNAIDYTYYSQDKNRNNKPALLFYNENRELLKITFGEMEIKINQFANYFKQKGLSKGDHVFVFLERCPEIYYAFLACIKIGAIPSTLFAAFQEQGLWQRLENGDPKLILTNKELLPRLDSFKDKLPSLQTISVLEDLKTEIDSFENSCSYAETEESDPLFMLYTSSTGNTPVSGIVTPQKALKQQVETAKLVLDLKEDDVYWCTADPGWVTGTVYGILVPWILGITQVILAGRFDPETWFKILSENKVNVWYTAPTALRLLQAKEDLMKNYDFSALRWICSVGEALPENTINWCEEHFGQTVHDTWWQTETGAIMIANYPHGKIVKGSIGKTIPGIKGAILDDNYQEVGNGIEGNLVFEKSWPSMLIDVYKNKDHFDKYFHENWYITGDRAKKDDQGYFWFAGRADDIIKTSGERVSPVEVEACLMEHANVAEAGVIGKPDETRGEIIKAFLVLKPGINSSEELKEEIKEYVKSHLAGHAYPKEIEFVERLPKNKAGKVIRRILKSKELGLPLGDTSTLEEA